MGLFPTSYTNQALTVPKIALNNPIGYKRGLRFDSKTGDLLRDGQNNIMSASGIETWKRWCELCFSTQRGKYQAYSTDFGIDIERALNATTHIEAEMILRKEITEAALADDYKRTDKVDKITFEWIDADSVSVHTYLTGIDGASIDVCTVIGR